MQYKPLHDHILIQAVSKEEQSKGGIILPDTVDKEKPEMGEVVAVGEGKMLDNGQRRPLSVAVGNKVVFKSYAPDKIPGDEELYIISEDDVLAIVE